MESMLQASSCDAMVEPVLERSRCIHTCCSAAPLRQLSDASCSRYASAIQSIVDCGSYDLLLCDCDSRRGEGEAVSFMPWNQSSSDCATSIVCFRQHTAIHCSVNNNRSSPHSVGCNSLTTVTMPVSCSFDSRCHTARMARMNSSSFMLGSNGCPSASKKLQRASEKSMKRCRRIGRQAATEPERSPASSRSSSNAMSLQRWARSLAACSVSNCHIRANRPARFRSTVARDRSQGLSHRRGGRGGGASERVWANGRLGSLAIGSTWYLVPYSTLLVVELIHVGVRSYVVPGTCCDTPLRYRTVPGYCTGATP